MSGNATAVSYVNSKGSIEPTLFHKIAKEIWIWFNSIELWVSAAHILVTGNCKADSFSSNFKESTEWKCSGGLFKKITSTLGIVTVDLFAFQINYQINKYMSWKPEPRAMAIDKFSIKWNTEFYHIFPPFSLLGKVASKIVRDQTQCIITIPK